MHENLHFFVHTAVVSGGIVTDPVFPDQLLSAKAVKPDKGRTANENNNFA